MKETGGRQIPGTLPRTRCTVSNEINANQSGREPSSQATMELAGVETLLLAIILSCIFVYSTWNTMYRKGNLPPGPTPLPIIGNLLQMKWGETAKSMLLLYEQYGPVYTVYLGSRRVVILNGYDAVKEALIDQANDFSGRGVMPSFNVFFQSFGIVFSNGERWKQLRRFSLMTLRNFGMGKRSIEERIKEEAQFLVEDIRNRKGQFFDPSTNLNLAVANVICSIVFNDRLDYNDKKLTELVRSTDEIFEILSSTWGQLQEIFPGMMKYMPGPHQKIFKLYKMREEFIVERVKMNQQTLDPSSPRDYIDCFLIQMEKEKQNPSSVFNMVNLNKTVENLFYAGSETVNSTLKWGLHILLKYPEIEERIHEEIDRVIGTNRCPVIEDRSNMPYTDAVIHEIQRYSDILPMNVTHSVVRDTTFRGFIIPEGTDVIPMLTSVLKDKSQFKDPENFHPEHFLDENGAYKKNDAFLPFSTGKRVCLGEALARMELFLFFTNILQNFNLRSFIDPKDIDIIPRMTGFANQAPDYKIAFICR